MSGFRGAGGRGGFRGAGGGVNWVASHPHLGEAKNDT